MPVTVTDWKRCLYVFFKRQNLKMAFYQHFRTLNASHPTQDEAIRQSTVRMPPRAYFFPGRNAYISQTLQVTIKKVVYHIIFIVLAIFQGIWRFWVYECTCLRIYIYIHIYLVVQTIVPHNPCVPSAFLGVFLETQTIGMYIYIESFFENMMQTHPSMLEYASAGPCTLHPMRFPEATFFLATYLYIYLL